MAVSAQQLFKAIHTDDQAAAKRALNLNPALVHAKHPRDAHTPLHSAAALGNLQLLKEFLHLGASYQSCDSNNETPLHVAARQGQVAVVKELLTDAGRRSCLRSLNRDGATPLHLAVAAGHTDVVQLLLNAGARGDLKDRAGRTPLDLVDDEHRELAEILIQGRQLTPGSGGRARRMISPGVSPTPFQGMSASPSLDKTASDSQHQDTSATADAEPGRKAGRRAASPAGRKAVLSNTTGSAAKQALPEDQQPADRAGHHDQAAVKPDAAEHEREADLTNQQSWLQFSPQRPSGSAFRQRSEEDELQQSAHPLTSHKNNLTINTSAQHDMPRSPAPMQRTPGSAAQHGIIGGTAHTPGSQGLHYQQQRQQQQQPSQQMGPLSRARAAGPLSAGAAAAAAVSDLARSFDHHPLAVPVLTASMGQHNTAAPLKQQHSTLSTPAGAGGASHIVSPEASSGLLAGPAPTAQHSARDYHAAMNGTGQQPQQHAAQIQQPPDSYHSIAGPAAALSPTRRSLSLNPASGGLLPQSSQHSVFGHHNQQNQQQQQQQQFAALAAAVSGRVGPLQLPVQSQLSELSSKVHQLEEWFEAQVELIPEWQKVLTVVQGVKRQVEEQQHKLAELDVGQNGSLEHLATQVAKLQTAQASTSNDVSQVSNEQESIKGTLSAYGEQISQFESQLVHQTSTTGTRISTQEARVESVSRDIESVLGRLATLETALMAVETRHEKDYQEAVAAGKSEAAGEATTEVPATGEAAAASPDRLAAVEADIAELKGMLRELQQSKSAPTVATESSAVQTDSSDLQDSPAAEQAEQPTAVTGQPAPSAEDSKLAEELSELKQRVSDLSVSISGMDDNSPLQVGAVDDTILPFMETTSNCLQQHEQQLDALQALVPKLESVVEQRSQMCELMQQVASLQTAFHLLTGGKDTQGRRGPPNVLSAGPLGAQKAAADYLAMATSMVKLQGQMDALAGAVEQLQQEWESASQSMRTEHETIRSSWEQERARMSAWEREATRRQADQQKEIKAREEKLIQIREAALAEEAARRRQYESEARVTEALDSMKEQQQHMQEAESRVTEALHSMQEQQQQLESRIAGLNNTTEAVQGQLGSLQAELKQSLAELAPHVQQLSSLEGKLEAAKAEAARAAKAEAAEAAKAEAAVLQKQVEAAKAEAAEAARAATRAAREEAAKAAAEAARAAEVQAAALEQKVEAAKLEAARAAKAEAAMLEQKVEAAKLEAARTAKAEAAALELKVEAAKAEAARAAKAEAAALEEKVKAIKAEAAAAARAEAQALAQKVEAARAKAAALEEKVKAAKAEAAEAARAEAAALEEKVKAVKAEAAAAAKAEAAALQQQVEAARAEAAKLEEKVKAAEAKATAVREEVEAAEAETSVLEEKVEAAKAEAAVATRDSAFAVAKAATARASAYASSHTPPEGTSVASSPLADMANPFSGMSTSSRRSSVVAALSLPSPTATGALRPASLTPRQGAGADIGSYLYWHQEMGGPETVSGTPKALSPTAGPLTASMVNPGSEMSPVAAAHGSSVATDPDQTTPAMDPAALTAPSAPPALGRKFSWFKSSKSKSKRGKQSGLDAQVAEDQAADLQSDLPASLETVSGEPAALTRKPSKWTKKLQKLGFGPKSSKV